MADGLASLAGNAVGAELICGRAKRRRYSSCWRTAHRNGCADNAYFSEIIFSIMTLLYSTLMTCIKNTDYFAFGSLQFIDS